MEQHLIAVLNQSAQTILGNSKLANMVNTRPQSVDRTTVRSHMSKFKPKNAQLRNEQYDVINLKGIIYNCPVYSGWINHGHEDGDGYLQTLHDVCQMRNHNTGHNGPLLLRRIENIFRHIY